MQGSHLLEKKITCIFFIPQCSGQKVRITLPSTIDSNFLGLERFLKYHIFKPLSCICVDTYNDISMCMSYIDLSIFLYLFFVRSRPFLFRGCHPSWMLMQRFNSQTEVNPWGSLTRSIPPFSNENGSFGRLRDFVYRPLCNPHPTFSLAVGSRPLDTIVEATNGKKRSNKISSDLTLIISVNAGKVGVRHRTE